MKKKKDKKPEKKVSQPDERFVKTTVPRNPPGASQVFHRQRSNTVRKKGFKGPK